MCHRRGRARWRASPRELLEQTTAEPGRLLTVHSRDGTLDAGGGLRVGVGVEGLRVAASVGAQIRNRNSTLCRDRADTGGSSWCALPDTTGTVTHALSCENKDVLRQAVERGEVG